MRVVIIAYPEGNVKGDWENTRETSRAQRIYEKVEIYDENLMDRGYTENEMSVALCWR